MLLRCPLALNFVVLLLLHTILPLAAAVNAPPPPPSVLCLLPIGDSLTQGVDKYGSYRQYLPELLVEMEQKRLVAAAHEEGGAADTSPVVPQLVVRFAGSQKRTCTLKHTTIPFAKDTFLAPHEGHCGWNSRLVFEHVQHQLAAWLQGTTPAPNAHFPVTRRSRNAFEAAPSMTPAPRWAIHPYAQQCGGLRDAAAAGEANDDAVTGQPRAPDAVLFLVGHNDAFQAAKFCKVTEGLSVKDASPRLTVCVAKFLQGFEQYVTQTIVALLSTFPDLHIVLGLNPTTRFPVIDAELHRILHSIVMKEELVDDHMGERGDTLRVRPHRQQVGLASFDGWSTEHTFDSTHPNPEGARLMAKGWVKGLEQLGVTFQSVSFSGAGGPSHHKRTNHPHVDGDDDKERSMLSSSGSLGRIIESPPTTAKVASTTASLETDLLIDRLLKAAFGMLVLATALLFWVVGRGGGSGSGGGVLSGRGVRRSR